jgi:superfamily I DNA/RNA helicase
VKRAKGLEFKHVLIADASDDVAPGAPAPADPAERERWELRRRELYVAMTRARDGLWVAVVWGAERSR